MGGDSGGTKATTGADSELTARIIECIITVHTKLGPGFLENIYRRALLIELEKDGLLAEAEKDITVLYDGRDVGRYRLDIVVEGRVILELKAVGSLGISHYAQLRSYLRATGIGVGLLVNFSEHKADFRRVELNR